MEFEGSTISLDIPLSSGVDINEWRLKPLVKPKVIFSNSSQIMLVFRVLYADIKEKGRLLQAGENRSIHEA